MVESSEPEQNNAPQISEKSDSIEEEKAPPKRQSKEKKEPEMTDAEAEAFIEQMNEKNKFKGEVKSALQEN